VSDPFVTVATYSVELEAQMAKNLLQTEGIEAVLAGNLISGTLAGISAMGDQIVLQVRAGDAQRAVAVLASVTAHATLDEDWEDQAERAGWTCSLCGSPVAHGLAVCPSCQTPRDSIRTGRSGATDDTQLPPGPRRTGAGIQKSGEVRAEPPPPSPPPVEDAAETPAPAKPAGCLTLLALLTVPALGWGLRLLP
jgi:hypothetical protein